MKQRLLLLGICLYLATAFSAVAVPYIATELPFACGKLDKGTYAGYSFWSKYTRIGISKELFLGWEDARLAPSIYKNRTDWVDDCRAYYLEKENFKLATFRFGFDVVKELLYTSTEDGYCIDALTVGASFITSKNPVIESGYPYFDFLQYEITADLQVIVYQLYPISDAPLDEDAIYYFDFANGMLAQRVDRVYQIDKDGYFHQVSETRYIPQTYTAYQMLNTYYNIWDGYETVQWWYEPDFAYRPPYRTVGNNSNL